MMQVATVSDDQPWICTVYYVFDDELSLYWASIPERRHSQEIAVHPKVAAAIAVKFVNGEKVIGVQVEGGVEMVKTPAQIKPIAVNYAAKFGRDKQWIEDFSNQKTQHRLYKLKPRLYVLFDEENFPNHPRQEFKI